MTEPREDGPRLQQLFTKLDGPVSYRQEIPDEFKAMLKPIAGDAPLEGPLHGVPTESLGRDGEAITLDEARAALDEGGALLERVRALCTCGADLDGGEHTDGCGINNQEAPVDVGLINYAQCLHEAGEAAIQIVKNMVDAEISMGNPRNIPEPIMGWYVMTMAYQLCLMEACDTVLDVRIGHAQQLSFALKAFKTHAGAYADAVREDVATALAERYRPAALEGEDRTYAGLLA